MVIDCINLSISKDNLILKSIGRTMGYKSLDCMVSRFQKTGYRLYSFFASQNMFFFKSRGRTMGPKSLGRTIGYKSRDRINFSISKKWTSFVLTFRLHKKLKASGGPWVRKASGGPWVTKASIVLISRFPKK